MDCQAEKVDRPLDPEDTCHALDAPEPDQLGGFLGKVEVADHQEEEFDCASDP